MTIIEPKQIWFFLGLPDHIILVQLIIEHNDRIAHEIRYLIIKPHPTIKLINDMQMMLIQFLQYLLHIFLIRYPA